MVRIQFDLPENRIEEIEAMMKDGEVATRKDFFNNALTLLEWAIKERKQGKTIAAIDERNKTYKELVMPILNNASKSHSEQPTLTQEVLR